ncbi:hypothetical protein K435DRAFT_514483 [Dendrothele bispora CBS 962.96]|uniref:Uncharacterized protein n=1 Tax=Dendrothele bispora (strain CBS 962.96) TaxID=1314807 RepID=A0A4S8M9C4_DENBC|nr:hypothetical protein K435DRAFT_514483 [Dendrothele bispora CBS 962.96]
MNSSTLWGTSFGEPSQIRPLFLADKVDFSQESLFSLGPLPAFSRLSMGVFPPRPISPENDPIDYESDEEDQNPNDGHDSEEDDSFAPLPSLSFQARSKSRMSILFDPSKFEMKAEEPEQSTLTGEFKDFLSELDTALDFNFSLGNTDSNPKSNSPSDSPTRSFAEELSSLSVHF